MSRLNVNAEMLNPDEDLLPLETQKEVNEVHQNVKIQYPANITMAEELKSKSSGNLMLKLTWTIKHPNGKMINIDDYLAYSKAAQKVPQKSLNHLIKLLKFDPNNLESDDFLDQWILVTIEHQTNKGNTPDPDTGEYPEFINNKISKYVRQLTAEELQKIADGENLPF